MSIADYLIHLDFNILNSEVTYMEKPIKLDDAVDIIINKFKTYCNGENNKIIFIGNGGSSSIADHMSIDFWKNGHVKAINFNNSSLLTCLGNDYGFENIFKESINVFGNENDMLIAISSSGKSKDILNGVDIANKKGIFTVTLSGFSKDNPLRKMGDLNIYIPTDSYGIVELSHSVILHMLLDKYMEYE